MKRLLIAIVLVASTAWGEPPSGGVSGYGGSSPKPPGYYRYEQAWYDHLMPCRTCTGNSRPYTEDEKEKFIRDIAINEAESLGKEVKKLKAQIKKLKTICPQGTTAGQGGGEY